MTQGLRALPGWRGSVRDYGLGAGAVGKRRVGFAGCSKSGTTGTPYKFKSQAEMLTELEIGTAVEQLSDLFIDAVDKEKRERSIDEVIYFEIDPAGETPAVAGVVDVTGAAGDIGLNGTVTTGGTPWHNRTYAIKVTKAGDIGTAYYQLCRNYEVPDEEHRVWEPEKRFLETAAGPPKECQIFLEEPGTGYYVKFTQAAVPAPDDFDEDDIFVWTSQAAIPTTAKAIAAINELAAWRSDELGIGGPSDITIIGCDQVFANTDWDDVHAIPTAEWDDNMHPVHVVCSIALATLSGSPATYQIDTWITAAVDESETYRQTTLPANEDINGGISLCSTWLLRETPIDNSRQVRHQNGSIVGQLARSELHWSLGRPNKFNFRGAYEVYPWNSEIDNMRRKPAENLEHYRTSLLVNDGHFLQPFKRPGAAKIVLSDSFAMCDDNSDYFLIEYYRVAAAWVGPVARVWFVPYTQEPGVSSADCVLLQSEFTEDILKPNIVDPNEPHDAEFKPFDDASISISAPADVLVTRTLEFEWYIVPVGSKRALEGFVQLVPEIT